MSPIFCPKCKHVNESGATTCAFCNEPLVEDQGEHSSTAHVETGTNVLSEVVQLEAIRGLKAPEHGIAIYDMSESPKPIAVMDDPVIILGRYKPDTPLEGFVDLTPHGGYEEGVSHKHAMLRKMETGYELLDMGSTNGTWLNRKRILPNHPYPLESGSQINLGRLCLFLVFD